MPTALKESNVKFGFLKVAEVLLVGSESEPNLRMARDITYCKQWENVQGRHAAIVALAYSGPERNVIVCADFTGEVTLINAKTMQGVVYLSKGSHLVPHHLSTKLCFIKQRSTGDYLIAHTGAPGVVSGAIRLWNIDKAQKIGETFILLILEKSAEQMTE